jgi:predicted ATP-grasp superfamily ATP-dependent carboligase
MSEGLSPGHGRNGQAAARGALELSGNAHRADRSGGLSPGHGQKGQRSAIVFGLLHAGLALVRSLGRAGIAVHGMALHAHEFGLRSRYLRSACVVEREGGLLEALRSAADGGARRPVLFPERDENVETVLRRWDEVRELADLPLPDDPEITRRLRRKDVLPEVAAAAGVPTPQTVRAESPEAIRTAGLRLPLLLKAVEGQEFALTFGEKAFVARDLDEAVAAWKRARERGFDTIVQELIPDSHDHVFSLFTYIGRDGRPLASVVGRKVRQGPLRFGTSAVFAAGHDAEVHEVGHRLLRSAGYTGLAHVELVRDPRDGRLKLLEVNTRPPIWAGIAMGPELDIARVAYDDLCGAPPAEERTMTADLTWVYLAKDVWVSAQMARRRELHPREFLRHYLRRRKVRAVFAADDPRPALASLNYLRTRV